MTTPERTKIASMDDLAAIDGKPVGVSQWHTVTYEDIVAFADATGDHQWIHVDRERAAAESPFGKVVAHGYYGIARIGGLFKEVLDLTGCSLVINYGINKARFVAPMVEGSRYRLVVVHSRTEPKQGHADVTFAVTIELEGVDKPACAAEVIYRFAFA